MGRQFDRAFLPIVQFWRAMFRSLSALVFACLLVAFPYVEAHAAPVAQQQNAQGYQGEVNTVANLRNGPGLEYSVVAQAQPGQIIIVVACNADCTWLKLSTGNWIAAFLVNMVALPSPSAAAQTTQQTPVIQQPATTQSPSVTQPAQSVPVVQQPVPTVPSNGGVRDTTIDPDKLVLHEPSQAALDIVAQILSYTGLPQNFDLYSANIYNAAALMVKGKRVILYDPQLIADIENVTHRNWAAVSIFAHEIGHHLAGHTLLQSYDKQNELQADYFSGYVLQKMGATIDDAQAVMKVLPDHANMVDHPPQSDRLASIEAGWQEAARQETLAAWQPNFPNFADEVARDSQEGATPGIGASLLEALRQAQSQQFASDNRPLVAAPVRDWSLGFKALAGAN
jgi:uncharacterized protein YraI